MAKKPDSRQKIDLEDLLQEQDSSALLATVEPVANDPNLVKLTPWAEASGCNCHAAIQIPKSSIAALYDSGHTHWCCGKRLKVMEVELDEKKSIPVTQVVDQLSQRIQHQSMQPQSINTGPGIAQNLAQHLVSAGAQPQAFASTLQLPAHAVGMQLACGPGMYACCCGLNNCGCCSRPCSWGPCSAPCA